MPLFVAEVGGRVAGLAGLRVLTLVERDEPVGRLIALVAGFADVSRRFVKEPGP